MNHSKKFLSKNICLNYKLTFLILTLLSILLTFIMFWIQPTGIVELFTQILPQNHYLVFFLNLLPILLLTFLLFFLTNNLMVALSLSYLVIICLSIANRLMIILRNAPLRVSELTMGLDALTVTIGLNLKSIVLIISLITSVTLIIVLLCIFIKNKKLELKIRMSCLLICLFACFLSNKYIISNTTLYNSLYVYGNQYNPVYVSNSKGFIYNFIYSYEANKIKKPEGYSKQIVEGYIDETPTVSPESIDVTGMPNIIIIQSEAFSDIALNPLLNFEGYVDPLYNYKQIKQNSISGNMVVANIGGGTADTEFDVLTGVNTRQYRGSAYSYMMIDHKVPSIVTVLNSLGYTNTAIHPGYPWFYDRQNVFPFLGFSEFIDINSFPEDDYKGMYVSETSTYNQTIKTFEENTTGTDVPFFEFVVTIQNHGPYYDKYLSETNFSSTAYLSEEDIVTLSNYFEGVADQDRELARLIEYLEISPEPTIVLYFGDHLPALSTETYNTLVPNVDAPSDSFEGLTRMYTIPFIIWENEPAKEIVDISQYELEHETYSSFYIGAILLDILGYGYVDPYFAYLNDIKDEYPVILENVYFDSEYKMHSISDGNEDIQKFIYWGYYRIFDQPSW